MAHTNITRKTTGRNSHSEQTVFACFGFSIYIDKIKDVGQNIYKNGYIYCLDARKPLKQNIVFTLPYC